MHILGNFGPGGAEMGVVRLIKAMKDPFIRHSVCSIRPDLRMKHLLPPDVPCYSLDITGRGRFACKALASLFRRTSVDIAHVNNIAPWFDTALAAKLSGCRCIETFHGVEDIALGFSRLKRYAIYGAWALSNHLNAVSEAAADLFSNLTGIDRARVDVITNGIDTDFFSPVDPDEKIKIRRQLGLPEQGIIMGCVAALRPVKNHEGLISAFAAVAAAHGDAVLVLVGDGPLHDKLKARCEQMDSRHQVIFTGRKDAVDQYLKSFDIFVLNSSTEGLSYAVLEAMASGLPVVATDVGGNRRLVDHEKNGFLYPEGNEQTLSRILISLGKNPDGITGMGRLAREKVRTDYSIDTMVQKYQTLYKKIA
jgi:glycosyltransferase involved in cell wall biosynthesis